MDGQGMATPPRAQPAAPEARERVFMRVGDEPLPEGVAEGDEGVFVIRVVGVTHEEVEAERAAMEAAENVAY
jgi:precorrin-6x reductase